MAGIYFFSQSTSLRSRNRIRYSLRFFEFARKNFAERAEFPRAAKRIGPLSQIEGASSSVNEEVPGSAFRLKAASPLLAQLPLERQIGRLVTLIYLQDQYLVRYLSSRLCNIIRKSTCMWIQVYGKFAAGSKFHT